MKALLTKLSVSDARKQSQRWFAMSVVALEPPCVTNALKLYINLDLSQNIRYLIPTSLLKLDRTL